MSNTMALEIHNLCKSYEGFSINNVSFTLPTGFIMGLVGQNGAGKTTTIRLILNMAHRGSGSIEIFGMDNILDEPKVKQDIAVVFDDIYLVGHWTISEVEKVLRGFYNKWDSALFNRYANAFHLPVGKKVKELSRGMKMKLMLAVAMSHDAKLLLLDEPTSGLDPVARDELLDILRDYISDGQRSVLFSTHITSDLEKIADYITIIREGSVFYTGTKDDLLDMFTVIKGGPDDLTAPLRAKTVGLTTSATGFVGLLPSTEMSLLSKQIVTETPSIDDILVSISRGRANRE